MIIGSQRPWYSVWRAYIQFVLFLLLSFFRNSENNLSICIMYNIFVSHKNIFGIICRGYEIMQLFMDIGFQRDGERYR